MNRKKVLLAVLVALFVVVAAMSFLRMPKQNKVDKLKYAPGAVAVAPRAVPKAGVKPAVPPQAPALPTAPAGAPPASVASEGKLRLDLLEQQRVFTGFRRNLFKPLFGVEAPARPAGPAPTHVPKPPSLIPAPPGPVAPEPPVAPPPAPLPPPIPPVQRDMARFTFLGFLQKDGQKTIFLSKDREIFLVKKGDKLAGRYQAANITDDALTIRVLADGGEIVIPLVENKPLKPMKQ